ncbi:hypothetical protein RGQ29_024875 [Quercus rubra]|uniref:Uncharacterized protein n=1 Tax=Quercus rubra TaxID=3512 RepID=A0AAN7IPV0_QUERU|nr:hypothetical protein RGQ29_024875 [Quercus rubra]
MASLVLILSELVCPQSQDTKPELLTTTTSSCFSCVGTGTAFPARKPSRSETNNNNNIQSEDMLLVEDLAEQRICLESIWP